jgi:hypothetical protein
MKDNIVKLPCKIGDKVYEVFNNNIIEYKIDMFIIYRSEIDMYCVLTTPKGYARTRFAITEIGHTVFLSREEAERKLNK